MDNKRKTHTSSAVKNRYNAKTYDRISISLRKDTAAAYKAKCNEMEIPYSEPLREAIEKLIAAPKECV